MLKHLNTESLGEVIYLATPYTHAMRSVRFERYKSACKIAGALISQKCLVFSPIAHSHAICEYSRISGDWEQWEKFCTVMVSRCDRLWIATLSGWEKSKGIAHEVEIASQQDKQIELLEPQTLHLFPYVAKSKELQNV